MSTTQPATRRAAAGGAVAGPVRRHLGLALFVIAAAQLMVVLDSTVSCANTWCWSCRTSPDLGKRRR